MLALKENPLSTHKEFRSAFVTPYQRRDFLLDCAQKGFKAIREAWPHDNIRTFVFGSAAKRPINIGAHSDLDIAISGLNHIAEKPWDRSAILHDVFKSGLSQSNQMFPVDIITFNADDPQTTLAKEILKNGIEIKME